MKKRVLVLILILLVGFFLRFYHYDRYPRHGATFDEFAWTWQGISLWQKGMPTSWSPHSHYQNFKLKKFQGAWVRLVTPYLEHPPLFGLVAGGFALLTGSKEMFDISLSQIRILALILGTLSILLVFLLTKEIYDYSTAFLASFLYATIPTIVIGSRIVQNENFFIPLWLTSLLLMIKYLKKNKIWQRNLAFLLAGLLILAKIPWLAAAGSLFLILVFKKKYQEALQLSLVVLLALGIFFLYGWFYDWQTFLRLWGLQTARAKIGLETFLTLFTHPYLLDRFYPDGWIFWGWFSLLLLSKNSRRHLFLFIPILAYLLIFIFAIPGLEAQGWYRYPFYPFLTMATALVIQKMGQKPSFLNFLFFLTIAASAFHWGWKEIFGLSNFFFRFLLILGSLSFLPSLFWPQKFTSLAKKATYFWLIIFFILNILSVLSHVHS